MYEVLKLGEIKEESEARRRSREGSIAVDPFQEWRMALEEEKSLRTETQKQLCQAQARLEMFERLSSQLASPPAIQRDSGAERAGVEIDFDLERLKLKGLLQGINHSTSMMNNQK